MKVFAPGGQKNVAAFDGDFFQCFYAVGHKAGAEQIHACQTLLRQLLQRCGGVRAYPFGAAKTRLKGHAVLLFGQAQPLGQQLRGGVALLGIRITQLAGAFWRAMKAHQQHIPLAVVLPMGEHLLGQRANVERMGVVVIDKAPLGQVACLLVPAGYLVAQAGRGGA